MARVIVVNATYRLAPWADICYAADHSFWRVYIRDVLHTFQGELWTVSEQAREEFGLYWMRCGRNSGFTPEPDTINGGGNSGFQAIHLAATFGAKRIVLLGYDMQRTGGKKHWHGDHAGGLRNGSGFAAWMKQMKPLAVDLRKRGIAVINASRHTALQCFDRKTLEEVLHEITSEKRRQVRQERGGLEIAESQTADGVPAPLAVDEVQRKRRMSEVELSRLTKSRSSSAILAKKARRRSGGR